MACKCDNIGMIHTFFRDRTYDFRRGHGRFTVLDGKGKARNCSPRFNRRTKAITSPSAAVQAPEQTSQSEQSQGVDAVEAFLQVIAWLGLALAACLTICWDFH